MIEVEPRHHALHGLYFHFAVLYYSYPSQYPTMMKSAILAAILGSAAAFAPAQSGKASTALRAFEDEVRKDICML